MLINIDTPAFEDSMLRSIILYRQNQTAHNKDELFKMALFGIISAEPNCSISDIQAIFHDRFGLTYQEAELQPLLRYLIKNKYIKYEENNGYSSIKETHSDSSFYKTLESNTNKLLDGVIRRMPNVKLYETKSSIEKIRRKAQLALSQYYQQYGYSFVGLKKIEKTEETGNAVQIARQGLDRKKGDALILALCDLLHAPTFEEKEILQQWAKAYVTLELLNLSPELREFKKTKLRHKSYFIDTDVILHTITSEAKYSKQYNTLVNYIQDIGCSIFIPNCVIEEVIQHLSAAKKKFNDLGKYLINSDSSQLENSNVFIEDYINRIRLNAEDQDMSFESYLRNYYSSNHKNLIQQKIKNSFGDRITFVPDEELINLETAEDYDFAKKIEDITKNQEKGLYRPEAYNTCIAEYDARIYLTIQSRNQQIRDTDKELTSKTYLLTKSKKIKSIAEKKYSTKYPSKCICDPIALLAILHETGKLGSRDIDYIDLFDNPFLAFTAEKMWSQIQPLIDRNIAIKHSDIERLRLDVDTDFEKILQLEDFGDITEAANELHLRGYSFGDELLDATNQLESKNDEIKKQAEIIASKDKQIKALQAALALKKNQSGKEEYIKRVKSHQQPRRRKR